jgi:hypothetical protein
VAPAHFVVRRAGPQLAHENVHIGPRVDVDQARPQLRAVEPEHPHESAQGHQPRLAARLRDQVEPDAGAEAADHREHRKQQVLCVFGVVVGVRRPGEENDAAHRPAGQEPGQLVEVVLRQRKRLVPGFGQGHGQRDGPGESDRVLVGEQQPRARFPRGNRR